MIRLIQALQDMEGYRMVLHYGPGVSDLHYSVRTGELEYSSALEQCLLDQGYQTVFTSPHQPHFSYLEENKRFFEPFLISQSPRILLDQQLKAIQSGPLGDRFMFGNQDLREQIEPQMGDNHLLRIFDAIICASHIRPVCLIFQNAEAVLRHFEDQRTLIGLLSKWAMLESRNPNKILFCFENETESSLRDTVEGLRIQQIINLLPSANSNLRSSPCRRLPTPPIAEIEDYLRNRVTRSHSPIPNSELKKISRIFAGEEKKLSSWIPRIKTLPELTMDQIKMTDWFSAWKKDSVPAQLRLSQMVGLENVKRELGELIEWSRSINRKQQSSTKPLLNMVFTGPPGTGKTSVARLVGEILFDEGILDKGQLVETNPTNLVADHIGGTARRVNEVINSAIGGVLFIDEAYGLADLDRGGFVQEAVETLLSRMEVDKGKFIVILAGYQRQMVRLFRQNPGLDRRFPVTFRLNFPAYTPIELLEILKTSAAESNFQITRSLELALSEIFTRYAANSGQATGNAGEVKNLLDSMERSWIIRSGRENQSFDRILSTDDLPEDFQTLIALDHQTEESVFQQLDHLQGLQEVKTKLKRLANLVEYEQRRKSHFEDANWTAPTLHQIFIGNPGTGKTTTARVYGELLRGAGYLRKGHTVEISAPTLISSYPGESSKQLSALIDEAMDGVLFIDEAYALGRTTQSANMEVVDTLVKSMEDYKNRLVVVVAGYPQEMRSFLSTNPGLQSRFDEPLLFEDLSTEAMRKLLVEFAQKEKYSLPDEVLSQAVEKLASWKLESSDRFGNARTVRKLFDEMKKHLADRVMKAIRLKPGRILHDIPGWNEFIASDLTDDGIQIIVAANLPTMQDPSQFNRLNWVVRSENCSDS